MLLFFAVDYLVSIAATYVYVSGYDLSSALTTAEGAQAFIQGAYDMLMDRYVQLTLAAAVLSLPFLIRMYMKEKKRRRKIFHASPDGRYAKYVYAVILSAGVTLSVNLFLNALMIFRYAGDYQSAVAEIMTESLWLRILCIGIAMPVVEELIFRGLIYHRLQDMTDPAKAAIFSSVIFGLYHGSLLQGIYAFVLGWLIVYAYQKSGTFFVPVLMHVVSNLIGIGLNYVYTDSTLVFSVSIVLTGMAAVWAFFRFRRGSFGTVEQRQDAPAPGPSHDAPADIRPASEGQVRYRPEDYYPKEPEDTDDDPEEIHTLPGSKDGDDE